jgi:hypothetical protein
MQLAAYSAKITKRAKTRLKSVARTITIGHREETTSVPHKPDISIDPIYLTIGHREETTSVPHKPDISIDPIYLT